MLPPCPRLTKHLHTCYHETSTFRLKFSNSNPPVGDAGDVDEVADLVDGLRALDVVVGRLDDDRHVLLGELGAEVGRLRGDLALVRARGVQRHVRQVDLLAGRAVALETKLSNDFILAS